ncbi:hypothetical protein [Martelella mangrovi]|uniref:Uncharacterized protein n=1 Tax=Martelella mangrovi TaxID=1397477 RepID=A0ABV2ICS4_9HYPH
MIDLLALERAVAGPMRVAVVASERRAALFNHIASFISLGEHAGLSPEGVAAWLVETYQDHGYYEEWSRDSTQSRQERFLEDFVRGRRLLYDDLQVELNEASAIVRAKQWYVDEPPDALFYFDLNVGTFERFAVTLATLTSSAAGVSLQISHDSGWEVTHIAMR